VTRDEPYLGRIAVALPFVIERGNPDDFVLAGTVAHRVRGVLAHMGGVDHDVPTGSVRRYLYASGFRVLRIADNESAAFGVRFAPEHKRRYRRPTNIRTN
jgi:methylmalonyl-CoA mutase cobalamin-binding subunit